MKNYKSVKTIPTWKIREITSNDYCMSMVGTDYGPREQELKDVLWQREQKELSDMLKSIESQWIAYRAHAKKQIQVIRSMIADGMSGAMLQSEMLILKNLIEDVSGEQTCPFAWAIFSGE